jgi:hypothetical protein
MLRTYFRTIFVFLYYKICLHEDLLVFTFLLPALSLSLSISLSYVHTHTHTVNRRDLLPQWQNYPVAVRASDPPFNWDWLSQADSQSNYASIVQGKATLTEAYMIPDP